MKQKESYVMGKIFEDYFSEYQADMVSICLEYVDSHADVIYIYCSYESNTIYGDCFFEITKKVVKKHQLNDIKGKEEGFEYDVSEERQRGLLDIISEDIEKIYTLCMKYGKDMPTEMKLVYDVKKNSLKADYCYENLWTDSETKLGLHICEEWFEEVKKKEEG